MTKLGPSTSPILYRRRSPSAEHWNTKERVPGGGDDEKKEFLADVCSFANLNGGDILYGVRDERDGNGRPTGLPDLIVGVGGTNLSAERERLESIVRDGIKPRIPSIRTKDLQIPGQGSVLLLRVGRSGIKPHMVTFKGGSRFYSRHSTGKYQLDVQEIGLAFAEQRSLGEQLRLWRAERIARILSDETPVRLDGPRKLILHFVPASALVGTQQLGVLPSVVRNVLRPSSLSTSTDCRYNADGFLVFSLKGELGRAAYAQIFRNGCLEYADGYILNAGSNYGRPGDIPSKAFEKKLQEVFGNAISILKRLQIDGPVYLSCTLVGVKDAGLSRDGIAFFGDEVQHRFDRQIIQSPEVEIDLKEPPPYRMSLIPIVEAIWQANGYEGTPWLADWGLGAEGR